jgi:spore coat assemly protein
MIKIGDYVTRNKYNNDILFKVNKIVNNKAILCGVDLRLYADANINDLRKSGVKIENIKYENNSLDRSNYYYIPGVILHLDTDNDYLEKCMNYYKSKNIKCYGYVFDASEFSEKINELINKHNPNVIVITGHDAYYKKTNKYKNSSYFIDTIKSIRKKIRLHEQIAIVAGACQSDYIGLIKAGSSFASSPNHINIHALDPAIVASEIALGDINFPLDVMNILSKTNCKEEGFGGLKIRGMMICGYPRKE